MKKILLRKKIHVLGGKLCIGFDLDGVVIDHTRQFILACKKHGFSLKPWQVNSNVFKQLVPDDTATEIKKEVYEHRRLASRVMPGSLGVLRALRLHIVIASVQKQKKSEEKLWIWLRKHGFLAFLKRKQFHIFRTRTRKVRFLTKLKPQVFIDDGLDVLEQLPRSVTGVLFDPVGAHTHIKVPRGMAVVKNWKQIGSILRYHPGPRIAVRGRLDSGSRNSGFRLSPE